MDRDAIARGQRRRTAEEALEVERDRMVMLEGEIEDLIAQLHGGAIDEAAFAVMQPEDVQTVRELLGPHPDFEVEEEWAADDEAPDDDGEPEPEEDPTAELEEEISRLEAEIEVAKRRRQALERYLEALGP